MNLTVGELLQELEWLVEMDENNYDSAVKMVFQPSWPMEGGVTRMVITEDGTVYLAIDGHTYLDSEARALLKEDGW